MHVTQIMRQLHSLTIILKISLERILFLPPERIQFSQLHEIVPKSRSEIHYMKICKVRIWIQKEQVRSGNNWTVDVTKGLFLPYKRVSYNSFCDYHIWLTGKKKNHILKNILMFWKTILLYSWRKWKPVAVIFI